MHATLISSIQASSHQKENVWSSCCSRLDYIRALLSNRCLRCHPLCHDWRFKPQLFYLILAIFLVFKFNSSLLLYVYCYKNFPWKSASSPWCNQHTKKTDEDTVHCDSCIFIANVAIYSFQNKLCMRSCITRFLKRVMQLRIGTT